MPDFEGLYRTCAFEGGKHLRHLQVTGEHNKLHFLSALEDWMTLEEIAKYVQVVN